MERTQQSNDVVKTIFNAVAIAMSAAALALGTFGAASVVTLLTLLSVGLFCLAVASMRR
jgi:hypothetical protein